MLDVAPLNALADNYIWVISTRDDTRVAVVDPGESAPVTEYLSERGLQLGAILLTHHHPDHTGGVNDLLRDAEVPVYGPDEAARVARLSNPVRDGDRLTLQWLGLSLDVIGVAGHTAGHVAFHGGGLLFSGDTLFRGGCGRLFEGSAADMRASLDKLRALAPETLVYCGHEYTQKNLRFAARVEPDNAAVRSALAAADQDLQAGRPTLPSTIGDERDINPFMRWDASAVVNAAAERAGHQPEDANDVLAIVRAWKDAS